MFINAGLRSDEENLSCNIKTKLNVHAKEFFMNDVTAKNVYVIDFVIIYI